MTEVIARRTRSNSQLNDYLYCGWQYRLKRLFKVEETPSVWLAGGVAFHTATEEYDLASYGDPLEEWDDVEQWQDVFIEAFDSKLEAMKLVEPDVTKWRSAGRKTKEKPNGENIDWWREAGQKMIADYIEWRISTDDTWVIAAVKGAPGVEVKIEGSLGGTPVVGFVDRVWRDRSTGSLLVGDLKSGSRTPASPVQLAIYSVFLEEMMGEPVVWGAYYDARKQKLTDPVDLSTFSADNLGIMFDTLDAAVNHNLFLPNIDSHCNGCGVRKHCIWQGGIDPAMKLAAKSGKA